jgi:hypothetical protein
MNEQQSMVEFQHCLAGTRTEVWYGAVLVKIILQFYVVVTMCYHMVIAFFLHGVSLYMICSNMVGSEILLH